MIRIAAMSYLNALPFIYGPKHHPVSERMDSHFGSSSAVAAMMARNEADPGLVPVAAVPYIPGCRVVSDSRPFAKKYRLHDISYRLDKDKKEGWQDFWTLALEELKSKVRW